MDKKHGCFLCFLFDCIYFFSFVFENVMTKEDLDTLNFTVIRTDIKPEKIDTCLVESH